MRVCKYVEKEFQNGRWLETGKGKYIFLPRQKEQFFDLPAVYRDRICLQRKQNVL